MCADPRTLVIMLTLALFAPAAQAQDPSTLEDLIQKVKGMKEANASPQDIAAYLAAVTDRRLSSSNRFSLAGNDYYTQLWDLPGRTRTGRYLEDPAQRDREWRQNDQRIVSPSAITSKARWAWDNRVGNCNEAMSVTFYVLMQVGLSAQAMEKPGHDYTVLGMAPDADPNDPRTWGPGAVIVDGWTGEAVPVAEAIGNMRYVTANGRGVTFVSGGYNPGQDARFGELENKGILRVMVTRAEDQVGVDGVTVTAGGITGTTGNGGRAILWGVPVGTQEVSATPPADAYLGSGSASVEVVERNKHDVAITLPDLTELPLTVVTWDQHGSALTEVLVRVAGVGEQSSGVGGAEFRVSPGRYEIAAEKEGYRSASQVAEVQPRKKTTAFLTLVESQAAPVITAPADGSVTENDSVTVTGTADRETANLSLMVNGTAVPVPVAEGRWSARVALNEGENQVEAEAGARRSAGIRITRRATTTEGNVPRGAEYRLTGVLMTPEKLYPSGEVIGQAYDLKDQTANVLEKGGTYAYADHVDKASEGYNHDVIDLSASCSVRRGSGAAVVEYGRKLTWKRTFVRPQDQNMNGTVAYEHLMKLSVPESFTLGLPIAYQVNGSLRHSGDRPLVFFEFGLDLHGWPCIVPYVKMEYPQSATSANLEYSVRLNPAAFGDKLRYVPDFGSLNLTALSNQLRADHERYRVAENQIEIDPVNAPAEYRITAPSLTLIYTRQ